MSKKRGLIGLLLILALIMMLALAACGGDDDEESTPEPTATVEPTEEPTAEPTAEPTEEPTEEPTVEPTEEPTEEPTAEPTEEPTAEPTEEPAAETTDLGVVTIGTNAEYPPFEYVDEDGNIAGFDYDLVTALAERAGFEPEFVNTRWDGIFVALASGEFDMVASAATITEEREEIVDFTDPYFNAGQMIAVKEDSDITSVDDLAGLRIGVQSGTTGDIYVSENVPGAEVVRYDEITLAFQALGTGDVDAVVNDGPVSADIISSNPELGAVLVGDPLSDEFYGIAVQPDKPELLDAMNAALAEVIADGTYAEIYMKWFGIEPPSMFQPSTMVELEPELIEPTEEPTEEPTAEPTEEPVEEPAMDLVATAEAMSVIQTATAVAKPTEEPTEEPTAEPTEEPAAETVDLGSVTVGTNAEYPPFEYVDEDGNITGFDYDLVMALAERAGFEPEFVNTRWDGIFVALASGEFDMVASAATITEEREEIVDFTDPYFNAGQMIAVREADANVIAGPDDLAGLRIGVQSGTTGDIYASDNIPGAEVVRYDEITLAFQALGAGDVDAVVNDGPVSADIISSNPELGAVLVGDPLSDEFYGIAVQPDKPELLDAMNAALAEVIADGTYAEIYMKWFGIEPPSMFQPE